MVLAPTESELFDNEDYDMDDEGTLTFYNVVTKQQIGNFPSGSNFEFAEIDNACATLSFYNHGVPDDEGVRAKVLVGRFQLHYRIGADLLNTD